MKRILIHIPSTRGLGRSFHSVSNQNIDNGFVDLFVQRYWPPEKENIYGRLEEVFDLAIALAIHGGYDFLFSVDDDIVVPAGGLMRLCENDLPIVSGLYRHRPEHFPDTPIAQRILDPSGPQDSDDRHITTEDLQRAGRLIECTFLSTSVVLIRRDLLPSLEHNMGFDWKMEKRCIEYGVKLYADTTVRCGHIDKTGEPVEV